MDVYIVAEVRNLNKGKERLELIQRELSHLRTFLPNPGKEGWMHTL